MSNKNHDFLSIKEWHKTQKKEDIDKIIVNNNAMINNIINRYEFLYHDRKALMSEALIGLFIAASKYNKTLNIKFSTYAYYWIRAKILRFIQKINEYHLNPSNNKKEDNKETDINNSFDYSKSFKALKYKKYHYFSELHEKFLESSNPSLDEINEIYEYKTLLDASLYCLSKVELEIIKLRWLSEEKHTYKEISEILNYSIERIRQLEKNSFQKIKDYIQHNFTKNPFL